MHGLVVNFASPEYTYVIIGMYKTGSTVYLMTVDSIGGDGWRVLPFASTDSNDPYETVMVYV